MAFTVNTEVWTKTHTYELIECDACKATKVKFIVGAHRVLCAACYVKMKQEQEQIEKDVDLAIYF